MLETGLGGSSPLIEMLKGSVVSISSVWVSVFHQFTATPGISTVPGAAAIQLILSLRVAVRLPRLERLRSTGGSGYICSKGSFSLVVCGSNMAITSCALRVMRRLMAEPKYVSRLPSTVCTSVTEGLATQSFRSASSGGMCVVTVSGSVFSLLATVSWVDLETETLTPKGGMMTVPGLVANTSMNQR